MHCLMDVDLHKIENESPEYDIFISRNCFEPRVSLSYFIVCHCLSPQTSAFQCKDTQATKHAEASTSEKTMWEGRKRSRLLVLSKMQIGYEIRPWNSTWNLKIDLRKRRFLLETSIFRFHVKFRGSMFLYDSTAIRGCNQTKKNNAKIKFNLAGCKSYRCEFPIHQTTSKQPTPPTHLPQKKKSLIKNSTYITLGWEKPSVTRLKGHF